MIMAAAVAAVVALLVNLLPVPSGWIDRGSIRRAGAGGGGGALSRWAKAAIGTSVVCVGVPTVVALTPLWVPIAGWGLWVAYRTLCESHDAAAAFDQLTCVEKAIAYVAAAVGVISIAPFAIAATALFLALSSCLTLAIHLVPIPTSILDIDRFSVECASSPGYPPEWSVVVCATAAVVTANAVGVPAAILLSPLLVLLACCLIWLLARGDCLHDEPDPLTQSELAAFRQMHCVDRTATYAAATVVLVCGIPIATAAIVFTALGCVLVTVLTASFLLLLHLLPAVLPAALPAPNRSGFSDCLKDRWSLASPRYPFIASCCIAAVLAGLLVVPAAIVLAPLWLPIGYWFRRLRRKMSSQCQCV
jgi:hypothetical protein